MIDQTVNLTNCDREPIHIPGLIQPHGVLLVLNASNMEIIQVSNNTNKILGYQPEDLLGKQISELLNSQQIDCIQQCLNQDFENPNPINLFIKCQTKFVRFNGIVHQSHENILLELEPKSTKGKTDFLDFYHQVKGTITQVQKATTLRDMCQLAVKEVRKITGFERVMVYQFDEDGCGKVIAEDTNQSISYLDLRYPSTDIPQPARKLYLKNWLRIIPDTSYSPVELMPVDHPLTHQPLDLSLSVLRSVSPIHLEYLQNMGVAASMSISLIQNQKLWGLIACHHSSPKYIPYNLRTACEFIGQVMSLELANKEVSIDLEYKMRLKSLQTGFVETLSQAKDLLDGLTGMENSLLDLVSATGAFICNGDKYIRVGETPDTTDIYALLDWVKPHLHQNLFQTRSLLTIYPPAESFPSIASGILVLEISEVHHNYIIWFRAEVIQTINWGGNPHQNPEVLEDGILKLTPRKSFELWQETVRGCSLPWQNCEIEVVTELKSLIVNLMLRQAEELASINLELQRSNEELDSFAYIASHDLKEPLRGIHNYANFLIEDYADILNEDGVAKLKTLVRLTQRMEDIINSLLHFSRLGRAELLWEDVNLNDLVQQVITTLTIARPEDATNFRIPEILPTINCDYTQVNEVFTNLISNAIKYNDKSEKWIEIGLMSGKIHPYVFYIRDNGIGIAQEHQDRIFHIFRRLHGRDEYGGGTGVGLTIARKIVERHGGRIWLQSQINEGSTFYFTLSGEVII